MTTGTIKPIIIETRESVIGRSKDKKISISDIFYTDSVPFLFVNSYYEKNKKKLISSNFWWPTNMNRQKLLPKFEKLYSLLKPYKPHPRWSQHDYISYKLVNRNNLKMQTGYGVFELKRQGRGNRIGGAPIFNITDFISHFISETVSIKEPFSNSELEDKLGQILSELPGLKP